MQFINIVVHSVENMNFRVHLQYEFTSLGLDKYLQVSLLNSQVLKPHWASSPKTFTNCSLAGHFSTNEM